MYTEAPRPSAKAAKAAGSRRLRTAQWARTRGHGHAGQGRVHCRVEFKEDGAPRQLRTLAAAVISNPLQRGQRARHREHDWAGPDTSMTQQGRLTRIRKSRWRSCNALNSPRTRPSSNFLERSFEPHSAPTLFNGTFRERSPCWSAIHLLARARFVATATMALEKPVCRR